MTSEEAYCFRHLKVDIESLRHKKLHPENELRPAIIELLKDGGDAFRTTVAERILKEHKENINLNYCAKCGQLARTPVAQQCRHCGYTWRSE